MKKDGRFAQFVDDAPYLILGAQVHNSSTWPILESGKYTEITLTPDHFDGKLNLQGDSQVQLHGQFGIHGSQHVITLPVKVRIREQRLDADTQFPVPYQKWGMTNPSTFILRVDDTVQIQIHALGRLPPLQ